MNRKHTLGTKIAAGVLCLLSLGVAGPMAGAAIAEARAPAPLKFIHEPVGDYAVRTTMKFHNLKGYMVELTPHYDPCQCSKDYSKGVAWLNQDDQDIPISFTATTGGSCFFESSKSHWYVQLWDRNMAKAGRYEIWLDEGCMDYYAGLRTIEGNDKIDAHARPHKEVHDEQYIYFGLK